MTIVELTCSGLLILAHRNRLKLSLVRCLAKYGQGLTNATMRHFFFSATCRKSSSMRAFVNDRFCLNEARSSRTQRMSGFRHSTNFTCIATVMLNYVASLARSLDHQLVPRPYGLPRSAPRFAGEHRPLVDRAFGHAASPRRCTQHPGLPVSRARRSLDAPPDCALVCFANCKTIPPLHPSSASARTVCLLVWAHLPSNTHT